LTASMRLGDISRNSLSNNWNALPTPLRARQDV
jgi:hypothetical protein